MAGKTTKTIIPKYVLVGHHRRYTFGYPKLSFSSYKAADEYARSHYGALRARPHQHSKGVWILIEV